MSTLPNLSRRALGAATVALLLSACGSSSDTGSTGAQPSAPVTAQSQDTALHDKLPAKLKSAGTVKVATDASYAPNEFFDTDNKTIIGMDVDLGKALGQVMGVKFQFTNVGFDSIIPSLGTRFDLGMSSFTDNKKREQILDMVTYFNAGTTFIQKKGGGGGVTNLESLCGKKAGVEKGTTQLDDATAQSKKCTSAGKPAVTVQAFPDQNGANLALTSGRVDVVMADSPVNAYAVKQANGQFEQVGQPYGEAPYGIAVPKSAEYAGFSQVVVAALMQLVANGTYKSVLQKWGIADGAITSPVVNGATS